MDPRSRLRALRAEIFRVSGTRSLFYEGVEGIAWTLVGQVLLALGWSWGWEGM